jgi:hypothetical protein
MMTLSERSKHDSAVAQWLKSNEVKVLKPQKNKKSQKIGEKYTIYNLGKKRVGLNLR